MNKKIAEWYVRNRGKINAVIIAIIVIALINVLLIFLSSRSKEKQLNNNNITVDSNLSGAIKEYNSISATQDEALTGDKIENQTKSQIGAINEFMQYCKEKSIEKAYELLSNECKEVYYPNIEIFKTNYYKPNFSGNSKNVSVQNYNDNVYKVEIRDDALATGVYNSNARQDYISVIVNDENQYKLNINGYLGRKEINKTKTGNNLDIIAVKSDQYKDYQTFTFKVTNKTSNSILLDDKLNYNSMYIEDENGIKYTAYTHEISEAELVITPGSTKELTIKYYNKYGTNKNITKIGFFFFYLNYDKNEVKKLENIIIEL